MNEYFKEMVTIFNEMQDRKIKLKELRESDYSLDCTLNELANLLQDELKRIKAERNEQKN